MNRSNLYYKHRTRPGESELCQEIVEIYQHYPFYGYRRITAILNRQGVEVNKKRVHRLMQLMKLRAIYPGPNTSKRDHADMVQPYLLKNLEICRLHQVWQIDITYLRVNGGFVYLIAIIDVYSRMVVSWRLSNDLCRFACIDSLGDAILIHGKADIINSDQGSQFTSDDWVKSVSDHGIKISMTGRGRSNDNAYIERLWRSLKQEGIYLHEYKTIKELKKELPNLINWYNKERPHQALDYQTPVEVACAFMDKFYNLPTTTQGLQLQVS